LRKDSDGEKEEEFVNNELLEKEPCRRVSGSFRAFFSTQAEAEVFAADPSNWPAYKSDIAHHCGKCGRWHLSQIEWLVPEFARRMKSVN
jgi:hypothetical protein